MYAKGFPVDDLVYLSEFSDGGLRVQAYSPLPGSGNQTRHNRPSRPLGCHTFADIHLEMRHDRVMLWIVDPNEP